MAFEGLSERLENSFKKLRAKGKLTESDVKEAMREVRMALLEADVNYKVAKEFTAKVTQRAIGADVMESLTPGQMVIKIVNEELTELMGGTESRLAIANHPPTVVMMCGLQGSGKTTHSAKLAKKLKKEGHRPLLVACDVYRPAAIKQLQVVGAQVDVPVFEMGTENPVTIAGEAVKYARDHGNDYVLLDTAGRLHVDEALMAELQNIRSTVHPHEILLVIDAMTGQDAVNVAKSFNEALGIDGKDVLVRETENRIRLGSIGGDLLLGSDDTPRIRLFSGLSDIDGDCLLVSPYGHACFPGSLTVRHDYGADLLSTYRTDAADEGIILHKRLRMGGADGFLITGDRETLSLTSDVEYVEEGVQTLAPHATAIGHYPSTSRYAPQNRKSESFVLTTDADFVTVGVPLEAAGHVGIDGSATRLANSVLYFTEELRLQAVVGGIKHYGDSLFTGSLSSEFFSSGFAGNGWAIWQNRTTGNVTATFDEVVARRRFRAYEFEVKKISAANGSLWVSDSCSGDTVEKL